MPEALDMITSVQSETFRVNPVIEIYSKLCFKVFLQYRAISELHAAVVSVFMSNTFYPLVKIKCDQKETDKNS